LLLGAGFFSTDVRAQSGRRDKGESADISSRESGIVKRIADLPEIKAKMQEVENKSRGKVKLQIMLHRKPDESIPYYWVKVNEPVGDEMVELYNFFLKQSSYEIKYYDTIKDTLMDLAAWRARK
jgi:hypothetical protein